MTGIYEKKLAEEGITLPDAPAPAANYVPYVLVEKCFMFLVKSRKIRVAWFLEN